MTRHVRVMELFAGVGGLGYGFSKLPLFEVVAANEIEPDIARAYQLNYPQVQMVNADIASLDEKKLLQMTGGKFIDLVVGGATLSVLFHTGKTKNGRAGQSVFTVSAGAGNSEAAGICL